MVCPVLVERPEDRFFLRGSVAILVFRTIFHHLSSLRRLLERVHVGI